MYYFDFTTAAGWEDSTITKLRFDPIKDLGSFEIDYIRLVPYPEGVNEPLDEEDMTLNYKFEDETAGTADGVISINFGANVPTSAEKIVLNWASGNATDGYSALADYSAIKSLDGELASTGYTINKNMLIPLGATAIMATVTDCDKTFTLVCEIPESKRAVDKGEPLYTVGLISDIHVGGWGSETGPNARLAAARTQLSELTDFVVVNGDLTQWYGAYSGEEFKAYNYNGTSYTDNGETSEEYLGIGTSQWTTLTDYFDGFTVPVYAVQGNHDIKDSSKWSDMIESEKYWRPFLEDWISYSNTATDSQKYVNAASLNDGNNYYDTEINGHHYIFLTIPKTDGSCYSFGEEQLKWLDKKLYEKEETGKPIFIFGHVPLDTALNGSYWDDQIGDDAAMKEILANHPTAIYVSGHTHYSLDVDFLSSIDGAQSAPSYIHDGGTTTISVPDDEAVATKTTEIQGSHGFVAKVYDDGIVLCGRDFVNNSWISRGYTYLTFKDQCAIDDITITKAVTSAGVTLTANQIDDVTYSWILDGVVSENTTNAITVSADYEGYVALRVTAADGSYRSEVVDNLACNENSGWTGTVSTVQSASMRFDSDNNNKKSGIRFSATIDNANRAQAAEYGYLITRQSFLDTYDAELTFDFKVNGNNMYVYGYNYLKNSDGTVETDKIFEVLEDGVKFTGIVTGLDYTNATQVCEKMVARPYVKLNVGGNETITYGEAVGISLKDMATYIKENDQSTYEANKALIDSLAAMSV